MSFRVVLANAETKFINAKMNVKVERLSLGELFDWKNLTYIFGQFTFLKYSEAPKTERPKSE